MENDAHVIKALRDNNLLEDGDLIRKEEVSLRLEDLSPEQVCIYIRKRRDKEVPHLDGAAQFTFSEGDTSFLFFSIDKKRMGQIFDFLINYNIPEVA